MIHNTLKCIYVVCALLLGPNPRPTFLYFPTVLPRPAEVLQKKTESDETRRLLGESLGEARRRLRRLLLEEREATQVAQTSCDEKWRKGWRRLLLENVSGKLAKWREPPAKWRELPAKWRELSAKWREVPAKWREVPAKWRKVAAKWRLLLESVRRVWW